MFAPPTHQRFAPFGPKASGSGIWLLNFATSIADRVFPSCSRTSTLDLPVPIRGSPAVLNLRPSPPQPVTADRGRDELIALWNAAAPETRTLMLAQVRAWAEVKGRLPRVNASDVPTNATGRAG